MHVLGIHDGHTATACYLHDGSIKNAVSEERFTRVKGQGGFPINAIESIVNREGIDPKNFDKIALVGLVQPLVSIDQYENGRQRYFPHIARLYPGDPRRLIHRYVALGAKRRPKNRELKRHLKEAGLAIDKVEVVEHHQAHAATAYYLSPFNLRGEATLVVTLDGSGDGLSGTISMVDQGEKWKRLKEISTFDSLGMIYSRVTQYLAMKPWEHEYKLMGMAPYADRSEAARVADVLLKKYIQMTESGLGFRNLTRLWGNSALNQLYRDLRGFRFDSVCAGMQMLHEKLIVNLVRNWLRRTGVRKLAVAGGCFMNVKANKLIHELDECDDLFIMPSCTDESCAIGAAIWSHVNAQQDGKGEKIEHIKHLYWGPEYSEGEIEETIRRFSGLIGFRRDPDIEKESAKLLAEHKIVGRMSGRMEWGARALGNRSILANPSRLQEARKLNGAVKRRDFWMPFAPSILWERRNDYAVLPKGTSACHMTMAYDSTPLAREHLPAALHPHDFTMRPQFVRLDHNREYHRLISEFERLTGIGGVLNTSFNLHGQPMVCSPGDAVETLLGSGLEYVTINDYLVWKKSVSNPE